MKLRDYQKSSLDDVTKKFRSGSRRVLCVLPCGAGKTVIFAYMAEQHCKKFPDGQVLFLVHRRELLQQAENTFDRMGIDRSRIHIAMAQTVTRRLGKLDFTPTFIVVDEASHSSASTWTNIFNAYPDVPAVGLTATPCRLDGKPLGNIYDSMSAGVSPKWLEDRGWLSHYDYYAPHVNLPDAEWKAKGSDFDEQDAADRLGKANIYGDVMKYLDTEHRKTIIYAPTVNMSKQLAGQIGDKARHFDADTPKKERDRTMDDFRDGKISVLCNCDLIGEGVDVPDCDCVMLLRPTKSTSLYIQQSCRCLRPYEGKRAVIYDFVGNVWRHGLPNDYREWSLKEKKKCRNPSGEKDVLCRQCSHCYMVYSGTSPICPYCGYDNKKTKAQLKVEKEMELERVKEVEKEERKRCYDFGSLVALGKKRGYKNPVYWANCVMKGRNRE